MEVTMVEPLNGKKSRVYVDYEFAFVLYQKEISACEIREGGSISREKYETILKEIVLRRAKLRCTVEKLRMDRTEFQLRQKLKEGEYPQSVIDEAVAYVKGYRYIDDSRYAKRYVACFREKKSRRQIEQEMMRKGIARSAIEEALAEQEPADEETQIRKWAKKKGFDARCADQKERQRFYGFLARRGFSAECIKKVCAENFCDNE